MELLMPTGEKTEKIGTLLTDVSHVSQTDKNMDLETLKQIDGKPDKFLETEK